MYLGYVHVAERVRQVAEKWPVAAVANFLLRTLKYYLILNRFVSMHYALVTGRKPRKVADKSGGGGQIWPRWRTKLAKMEVKTGQDGGQNWPRWRTKLGKMGDKIGQNGGQNCNII